MTATVRAPLPRQAGARLLRSGFVDLLLGPHGVDRYLELVSPATTVRDARAEVTAVRRQTARSVTSRWRPTGPGAASPPASSSVSASGSAGCGARTYSPAGSAHADALELTITEHPGGVVSPWLRRELTRARSSTSPRPRAISYCLPRVRTGSC